MTAATAFRTGTRTYATLVGFKVETDGKLDTFTKGKTVFRASYSNLDFIRVATRNGELMWDEASKMPKKMLTFRAELAKGARALKAHEAAIKVALAGGDEARIRKALATPKAKPEAKPEAK